MCATCRRTRDLGITKVRADMIPLKTPVARYVLDDLVGLANCFDQSLTFYWDGSFHTYNSPW